jgi:hypothetical protein
MYVVLSESVGLAFFNQDQQLNMLFAKIKHDNGVRIHQNSLKVDTSISVNSGPLLLISIPNVIILAMAIR